MRKFIPVLLVLFLVFAVSGTICAQEERLYFETDNFIINFQQQYQETAYQVGEIAEDIHQELVDFMGYSPQQKTHIIIYDNQDLANAAANPAYFNRIYLYLHKPDIYQGMVGYYEEWLRQLLVHEYTHILHLDMNFGRVRGMRNVLGKIPLLSTPNFLQPYWMIEGYAMYAETEYTDGGRGDNDLNNMHLRTSLVEDDLYSIDQVHGPYNLGDWPGGSRGMYYYGLSIFEYLAENYGEDKMVEISHEFSRDPARSINSVFRDVLGADIDQIYQEWKQVKEEHSAEVARELSDEFPSGEKITDLGWESRNPALSPDKERIAYIHTGNYFPSLRIYENGEDRQLTTTFSPSGEGISWSPSGDRIVYSELNYYDPEKLYNDIYIYDLSNDNKKQVTKGSRAYSPVWLDEETLVYLTQEQGKTDLVKYDLAQNESHILVSGSENYTLSQLSLSPNRDKITMSIWHEGKRDIYYYDLKNKEFVPLVVDDYINIHPTWSDDGNRIYFSSDRNDRFNLYVLEINSGNLYQLTDKFTGAFEPQVVGEEEIYYIGYSSEGYDLYSMNYVSETWNLVTENVISSDDDLMSKKPEIGEENHSEEKIINRDVSSYSPLNTLWPRFVIPALQFSYQNGDSRGRIGFTTGGIDALQNHQYQIDFRYDSRAPVPQFNFDYIYQRDRFPYLATQMSISSNNRFSDGEFVGTRQDYGLITSYPVARDYFHAGEVYSRFVYRRERDEDGNQVNEDRFVINPGLQGGFVFGQDKWQNNVNFNLNYGRDILSAEKDNQLEVSLINRLSLGNRNELGGRLFWGENSISEYNIGRQSMVRTKDRIEDQTEAVVFNLEFNRLLYRINSGVGHMPLFFNNLNTTAYYDYAYLPQRDEDIATFGLEVGLEMSEFYGRQSSELRLGVNKEGMWYLRLGRMF